jgi:acyl carrier protein
MSQSHEIYARIAKVFERVFDDVPDHIGPETGNEEIPAWDSVSHVNVILALEEEFKVKFTSAQVQKLGTVGQIADLIAQKTN